MAHLNKQQRKAVRRAARADDLFNVPHVLIADATGEYCKCGWTPRRGWERYTFDHLLEAKQNAAYERWAEFDRQQFEAHGRQCSLTVLLGQDRYGSQTQ